MRKNHIDLIQVDLKKCTKCGVCVEVCPIGTIGMDERGPTAVSPQCLACGHCVAICPSAALDNVKTPLAIARDVCAASGYKPLLDILNLPENMKVKPIIASGAATKRDLKNNKYFRRM